MDSSRAERMRACAWCPSERRADSVPPSPGPCRRVPAHPHRFLAPRHARVGCQTRSMPEIMVVQVLRPGRSDVRAGELLAALGHRMGHRQLQADLRTGQARLWVDMNVWDAYDVIT